MKRHWQITVCFSELWEEEEGCCHYLLLFVFTAFFFLRICVSKKIIKCGPRQGFWWHTTNTSMTEDMMRSASPSLSVLGSLPLSFFFGSTNWPWLRGGIVLAKMWKGYAWLRTSCFSNLLSSTGRGELVPPTHTHFLKNLQFFVFRMWTELRLKTLWSLISFFSIWGSGGREQFAGRGVCARACMCMTHLLWLVLCPSHPHTHASPFSVSSCKLLPGVTHGKSVFFFSMMILLIVLHVTHISVFNKTRWSRWLWHTRTLGIDCQFDRVTAYIPHHGELAVHIAVWALFPIGGSVTGLTRRKGHVYICLLYYEGFAHLKKKKQTW